MEYVRTQLKQLTEETGLYEMQIMNCRTLLVSAGIFPPHKPYKDGQYSREELDVLKRIGRYHQKHSYRGSIKLALKDVYGEDSLQSQKFTSWWRQYGKERNLQRNNRRRLKRDELLKRGLKPSQLLTPADYNTIVQLRSQSPELHNEIILKKLLKDFRPVYRSMLESYPLNLYSELFPSEMNLRRDLARLMSDSRYAQTFDEYETNIFDAYRGLLNGIVKKAEEPLKAALDKLHRRMARSAGMIERRFIQKGRLTYLESIGKDTGISETRVGQLVDEGMRRLRTYKEIVGLARALSLSNSTI